MQRHRWQRLLGSSVCDAELFAGKGLITSRVQLSDNKKITEFLSQLCHCGSIPVAYDVIELVICKEHAA